MILASRSFECFQTRRASGQIWTFGWALCPRLRSRLCTEEPGCPARLCGASRISVEPPHGGKRGSALAPSHRLLHRLEAQGRWACRQAHRAPNNPKGSTRPRWRRRTVNCGARVPNVDGGLRRLPSEVNASGPGLRSFSKVRDPVEHAIRATAGGSATPRLLRWARGRQCEGVRAWSHRRRSRCHKPGVTLG